MNTSRKAVSIAALGLIFSLAPLAGRAQRSEPGSEPRI
jgi:hypothetical protein